jgi:HEAT repeat protein
LTANNEDFVDKLIAAIRHPEPTRAALAIQVLSEMLAEPRAVPPLIDLLDSAHDPYVLRYAVVALGRFADRRAAPALSRLLLGTATPLVVRIAGVDALARIGGDEARAAIQHAMADPNASVRERAHRALHDGGQDGEGAVV